MERHVGWSSPWLDHCNFSERISQSSVAHEGVWNSRICVSLRFVFARGESFFARGES